jgi:amino acid adenylation domain-containing protein
MSELVRHVLKLPPEQQAIRGKCFHPSGSFSEFSKQEVEQSVPIRFQKIVRKYPDRIAVKTECEVLTYAELNAMANRVARAILAREGDKAGSIGLLLENSAELVAAMLGVLKAGKFFTLLDPAFPKARIVSILENSESRLVIANRQVASSVKEIESNGCRFLEFESAHSRISDAELRLHASPETFACIVYTSGSTGQPKGIVWAHRDLLHRIMLRTSENHPCEHDGVALLPAGTANAVTNIFFALLNGATLLPFDVQKEGVTRLPNWLLQERISICPISSPLFRNLCETLTGEERFPDLRVIRLRSEAVYKTDVDLYKKYFPPTCIFLTGLSTSETGQLTTYLIDHDTEITGNEVPVGYAVEDKEISLLDETGNQVGFNEVGEIVVRSRHLSPGYWRRPDFDRAKFKPDPEDGTMRLCFTGDLGLMLPDGCLIHKGRKDFRVKVRGYGVEFAEVEKALLEHEGIREAVVVAWQNQSGEARLVAYYIPFRAPGPNVSELRGFLKKKLPDYMIPSALVMVDAIPLTSNGKIDRKSLPDPKSSRPELGTPLAPPGNSQEEKLAKIWAEVLGLDRIGIHDNFLDLGGHSLAATRIIARVVQMFRVELPIKALFDSPTVAQMATVIMRNQGVKAKDDDNVSQVNADQTGQTRRVRPTNDFTEYIEQSIPDRFEQIVRHYPRQLAVKAGDRASTYEELNQATNRIARAILAKSGQGNEPIALLFEHGIDVIAAIFGTLKAGKFYVALDPSFPQERISYILDDSQPGLVITNNRNLDLAQKLTRDARALLNIDELDGSDASDNLGLALTPETLVNINYTSGSTGEPKGVVQTHRQVLNFALQGAADRRLCTDDRLTLVHFVGFGSASSDLFQSLLNGASLFPFDIKSEGIQRLAKWLEEERITVCHLPPALFRQLAELLSGQEKFHSLRLIYLSGAPVTQIDVELYKKTTSPGTLLHIGMGSTEAGNICSAIVDHTFLFPQESSPVGYPRPGKKILLLDENGHEVGPGQVGEIAVKGRNLNAGYWRRPELTRTKFLPDPSGGDERIYLTGDLGRMLPDGFLIHLGRKDFMVKIRGYRVEPAEIERALLAHPQVKDAGVVAWDQEPGEKYLVAYVVPREDAAPTINELYNFLKEKLPDYMMPSAFLFLPSLPLTNGKLDRRALPLPNRRRPDMDAYIPPKNEIEQKLVGIWEEVLDIRPIGIHDNFFELGGHSLLATQVVTRIRRAFNLELPLRSLFEKPSVAGLAEAIMQSLADNAEPNRTADILTHIESLSDEEAERLLSDKGT